MARLWYVLKAIPGRESRAKELVLSKLKALKLIDEVDELLIPVERITEVKRGKKVTTDRKLYPGYIYVQMQPTERVIEAIRSVDGVTGFLGTEQGHPEPLSPAESEQILKIAHAATTGEQRAAIVQIPFNVGDKVKVKEGTFAGMDGEISDINPEKGILKVLITVFGRQTPVELEVWQVEELS